MKASSGAALAALLTTALLAPTEARGQGWRGMGEPNAPNAPSAPVSRSFPAAPPAIRPPMQPAPPVAPPPPHGFPGAFPTPRPPVHDRPSFRAPRAVYAAPPVIYYGPPYAPPDAIDNGVAPFYEPGYGVPMSAAPQHPSPAPSVIQYPTGRYELRDDGSGAPRWVWIPNPPPPPPTAEPGPPGVPESPAPPATVYRWIDGEGVVHFTDRLDSVPPEQRPIKPGPSS